MSDHVRLEIDNQIARITFDNHEKRNAIAIDDIKALSAHLDEAAEARLLILTGAGDRAFSAGVDLSDVVSGGSAWDNNPLTDVADKLQRFPRPTIARINGAVIGGSAELAFACDFRIGVDSMKLMVPAVRIGVHYEAAGLARSAAIIGWQATRRIYLLGETLRADDLIRLGYFERLVKADELDAAVDEVVATILLSAPLAIDGMKSAITDLMRGEADLDAIKARIRTAWASDDLKEGLAAASEKRKPRFEGK